MALLAVESNRIRIRIPFRSPAGISCVQCSLLRHSCKLQTCQSVKLTQLQILPRTRTAETHQGSSKIVLPTSVVHYVGNWNRIGERLDDHRYDNDMWEPLPPSVPPVVWHWILWHSHHGSTHPIGGVWPSMPSVKLANESSLLTRSLRCGLTLLLVVNEGSDSPQQMLISLVIASRKTTAAIIRQHGFLPVIFIKVQESLEAI